MYAAEDGTRVLFDVACGEKPVQEPGEILGSETTAAKLLPQALSSVTGPYERNTAPDGRTLYNTLYPVFRKQADGDPALNDGDAQPEPLFVIVSYIRSSEVPDYSTLFILQILIQFSGFFILLLTFGFWISHFFLIYPVTAMSSRADQISGSLEDIVSLDQNIAELKALSIHTADETETLYRAVCRLAQSVSERMKSLQKLFDGTVFSLVNAIDAKDQYTHGHSSRVAVYSRRIAELAGKSEKECEEIYLSAILHDVGKIGIPGGIINKKGRLTDEEYRAIKEHPAIGYDILKDITEYPFLSVAAHYHHERYDGRGYPEGLKGEEIPEIARIIAVADAYDAMTSNRSYRKAIPQHIVREELVKGMETQFDPKFAKAMIHLLDLDEEYRMREMESGANLQPGFTLRCETIYHDCTEGIAVKNRIVHIRLFSCPDGNGSGEEGLPSLIVFDALDGKVHPGEENNKDMLYFEYARIRFDGTVLKGGVRKIDSQITRQDPSFASSEYEKRYDVEAVKYKDHALIRISDEGMTRQFILALPDSSRFVYLSITGERCAISGIAVENDENAVAPDYIPRIAEEISFIKDCPQGDVPNIQIDGWRSNATAGIPIRDGMTLSFHTMSLPTARLVWHCPYLSVFSSRDGRVNGGNFREFMFLRLDGENWESDEHAENRVWISKQSDFVGWNAWLERNKQGLDCTVKIERDENRITMHTENLGISVSSVTTIHDDVKDVFVALTGDQCAITNIRVSR